MKFCTDNLINNASSGGPKSTPLQSKYHCSPRQNRRSGEDKKVYLGVKTCEVFLRFLAIVRVL